MRLPLLLPALVLLSLAPAAPPAFADFAFCTTDAEEACLATEHRERGFGSCDESLDYDETDTARANATGPFGETVVTYERSCYTYLAEGGQRDGAGHHVNATRSDGNGERSVVVEWFAFRTPHGDECDTRVTLPSPHRWVPKESSLGCPAGGPPLLLHELP